MQRLLFLVLSFSLNAGLKIEGGHCVIQNGMLECDRGIPTRLPAGIKEVRVKNSTRREVLSPRSFNDLSWTAVIKLHLDADFGEIRNHTFGKLVNLRYLGIHSVYLTNMDILSFAGLLNLTSLDLSGCVALASDLLVDVLTQNVLPELRSLNLHMLHTEFFKAVKFNDHFMHMLESKKIHNLDLSGTNMFITDLNVSIIDNYLYSLNISNIIINFDRNQEFPPDVGDRLAKRLKILDASYIDDKFLGLGYSGHHIRLTDEYYRSCSIQLLQTLERFYFEFSLKRLFQATNVTIDARHCHTSLKVIHLRGIRINNLDVAIQWPEDNLVDEMNLSINEIKYVSPNLFQGLSNLTKLDLSKNNLFRMATLPEFERLFQFLPSLEVLNISSNKLSRTPYNLLANLSQLKFFDFSRNNLQTVNLKLHHLHELRYLNLEGNEIVFLSETTLVQFQQLLADLGNTTLTINLRGNPLKCSCDSVVFIEWLVHISHLNPEQQHRCNFENKLVYINEKAVQESKYLCIKQKIIVSASVSSAVAVLIIVTLVTLVGRKQVNRRKEVFKRKYIKQFVRGEEPKKSIAFLSYDVENTDLEEEKLITALLDKLPGGLKDVLGNRDNNLLFPDRHFHAGQPQAEETERCISEACVVIIMISSASEINFSFNTTLNLMKYFFKPVIFVTRKGKDYKSNLVKGCLNKYQNVQMILKDGLYESDQGWGQFCNLIIEMASENARNQKDTVT